MSRTIRNIKRGYNSLEIVKGGDAKNRNEGWGYQTKHKLRPYTVTPSIFKAKATKTDHVGGYNKGVSKFDKLLTRNCNRAQKKKVRRLAKKQIQNDINNLPAEDK